MRGIVSSGGYIPYRRLQRSAVSQLLGSGGGKGTRSVASPDEDTTTMAVEAARLVLRSVGASAPNAIWFATSTPAYLDKTNAAAIHAALLQQSDVAAFDFGGALRSGVGALRVALEGAGATLVVLADTRDGLPTSADESTGGDGAAALLVGDDSPGTPVIAEYLGGASITDEFLDRWRTVGDRRSKVWEERFGETRYVPLGAEAWETTLKATGVTAEEVDAVVVTGMHGRAAKALTRKLGVRPEALADNLTTTVGQTGNGPCRSGAGVTPGAGRPGTGHRRGEPGRRRRRPGLPDHRRAVVMDQHPAGGRSGGQRRGSPLREVPHLARDAHPRAAPPPGAPASLGHGGMAQRGVEVRLRRLAGPHQ